jgi:hypothetical protein
MIRHVPSADELLSEMWIAEAGTDVTRFIRTVSGPTCSIIDATGKAINNPAQVRGCSFNGKLFLAYSTTNQNRLRVWDGTTFRKTGLATASAPTVANTGAGAYAATKRYYKVSWCAKSGSTVLYRSELSSSVSFTPSGTGTAARVTAPAVIGESETHWEVWGSPDNATFFKLADVAVATTTYDDSATPSAYAGTVAPGVGDNNPPPSCKYIVPDDNRLVMAGWWGSSTDSYTDGKHNRIWYTPRLGTADIGDDERVPLRNWVDLDESDSSIITGLAVHQGSIYVFKYRQIWKLVPTGDAVSPYQKVPVTKAFGCIESKTIVSADDENGSPAIYFLSHRGPMKLSSGGIVYIGREIEDVWATVNLDYAVTNWPPAFGVAHLDRHQVWWWVRLASSNARLVFDTRTGGWTRHTGTSCDVACAAMFSEAMTTQVRGMKPYAGSVTETGGVLRCDASGATTDTVGATATDFRGYVTTKPYAFGGLGMNSLIGAPHVWAKASLGVTLSLTATRDYGLETLSSTASIAAASSETRVLRQFEGQVGAGGGMWQFTIGDAAAVSNAWVIDSVIVPYAVQEER